MNQPKEEADDIFCDAHEFIRPLFQCDSFMGSFNGTECKLFCAESGEENVQFGAH